VLTGNSAQFGGGAFEGNLYNCTLVGNSAGTGGGANGSGMRNCIVYFNSATNSDNFTQFSYGPLNYCCAWPMPTSGVGNFTNAPLFVDYASGNLRLQSNSPCINAGNNSSLTNYMYDYINAQYAWFTNLFDLDGNPRTVSGTVDVGAYEFQGSGSLISYAWLQQYGWPTDGSADFLDPDGDAMNNWQEWRCLTDPTNASSLLQLFAPTCGASGVIVSWQSVTNRTYFLERATNIGASFVFSPLAANLPGTYGTMTFLDTNSISPGPVLYRVGIP